MKETEFLTQVLRIKNNNIKKVFNESLLNEFVKQIYKDQPEILISDQAKNIKGFNKFFKYIKEINQNNSLSEDLVKKLNTIIITNSEKNYLTTREAESLSDTLNYKNALGLMKFRKDKVTIGDIYYFNKHEVELNNLLEIHFKTEKKNRKIEKENRSQRLIDYVQDIQDLKQKCNISNEQLQMYELFSYLKLFLMSNSYSKNIEYKHSEKEIKLLSQYLNNIFTYLKKGQDDLVIKKYGTVLIIKTSIFNSNIFEHNNEGTNLTTSIFIIDTNNWYNFTPFDNIITNISEYDFNSYLDYEFKYDCCEFILNNDTSDTLISICGFKYNVYSYKNSDLLKKFNKNEIEKLV